MITEQMIAHKCFKGCNIQSNMYPLVARAARRFAKMENKENQKRLDKSPGCEAILCHGPGHQSQSHCRLKGKHKIHETIFGRYSQTARWRSKKAFSGYFDEPPPEPKSVLNRYQRV